MTLTELQTLALAKAIKAAAVSKAFTALDHNETQLVDFTVRVQGAVSKGPVKEDRSPVSRVLSKRTVLGLLRNLGAVQGATAEQVADALFTAATSTTSVKDLEKDIANDALLGKAFVLFEERIVAALPTIPVKATISAKVVVEVVDADEHLALAAK